YDMFKFHNPPTAFEESLVYKNLYYLSQPKNDINIYFWRFNRVIRQPISSPFLGYLGYSLHNGNENQPYIESDLQAVPFILSLLGIIGGIWSSMVAFYVFLFGLGIISPWGFVQRSKPFKDAYKEKLSLLALDLQSDEPDINEKPNIKEFEISSMRKRLDNFEKRLQFYENIVDTSILTSDKTNASPTTGSSISP
ncbi:16417_t:CDS:2, partial [Cetraspora pellucida]